MGLGKGVAGQGEEPFRPGMRHGLGKDPEEREEGEYDRR